MENEKSLIENIAACASRKDKISPNRMFDVLKTVIAEIDDMHCDAQPGDSLIQLLATLYRYYLPSPKKMTDKQKNDPFCYVAAAVSRTSQPWRNTQHIYVRAGTMYATDMQRMHYAATRLEDGLYNTDMVRIADISSDFPPVAGLLDTRFLDVPNTVDGVLETKRLSPDEKSYRITMGDVVIDHAFFVAAYKMGGKLSYSMHRDRAKIANVDGTTAIIAAFV